MRHPDRVIKSNKPRHMGKYARIYKNTCSSESCWLRHQCIKNDIDRSMWDNNFAPYSPKLKQIQMNG